MPAPTFDRPHTLTVWTGTEGANSDGTALPAAFSGTGASVAASVQPISSKAAYDTYGIEVGAAYELFVAEEDGPSLPIGARVYWARTGQYMRVRGVLPWLLGSMPHYQLLAEVEANP
jgi:hypothetical protein